MEEPLIIKRDEIIFKIGFYICLIAASVPYRILCSDIV